MSTNNDLRAIVVISDLHAGCQLGLCPPEVKLDEGGIYKPSALQQIVWSYWLEFWNEWVPKFLGQRTKFGVVVNGDAMDGRHHGTTTQISQNLSDQEEIAYRILVPIVDRCKGRFWYVRGTEAHGGQSGELEERLARRLGAIADEAGRHARWELWKRLGQRSLIHFMHHVGTCSSSSYESTAIYREMIESYVEAGRWGDEAPNCIVRSHRHRAMKITIPAGDQLGELNMEATAIVTPGWQLKTPLTFRLPGARQAQPQFGGYMLLTDNRWPLFALPYIRRLRREGVE